MTTRLLITILMLFISGRFSTGYAQSAFGTAVGSYNGVNSYSNESGSYVSNISNYINGSYIGMEWQCVEYVRRYYYMQFGKNLYSLGGGMDAWQFFGNAANMQLTPYVNGGTTTPQVGDILCWNQTGSGVGHVAIVRAVGSSTVTVIQQNVKNGATGPNGTDDSYSLTYNSSTHILDQHSTVKDG